VLLVLGPEVRVLDGENHKAVRIVLEKWLRIDRDRSRLRRTYNNRRRKSEGLNVLLFTH
jgi:hypothetical protein